MKNPLISVIVPVYNGADYIEQTIRSVLGQPFADLEVIIINDGSVDNSATICRDMAAKNARVKYYEKTNEGIGATRNYGIQKSQGKYLTFLDQDDVWVKDFLDEAIAHKIEEGGDIVAFSHCNTNDDFSRAKEQHVETKIIIGGGLRGVASTWQHHSSMFFLREMLLLHKIEFPNTRHEDEIIETLYQSGMKSDEIGEIINKEFQLEVLQNYRNTVWSENIQKRIEEYFEHSSRFVRKNRWIGIFDSVFRRIFRISVIRKIWNMKRYPTVIERDKMLVG